MSDLIERLRSFKSALAQRPGNAPAAQAKLVGEAIAEIERLNDEIINIEALAKERYCAMQTEIERLRTDLELDKYAIGHYKDQIAKLRAALEHIGRHFGSAEQCRELAHSALKEADDV